MPFDIAPTGFTRMPHTAGERAGAAAAGAAGIPFSLSTVGTTTPEDVATANLDGRNWFQLYMWKDRQCSLDIMNRAARSGFDTLLLTVDVPVAGGRLRDRYNGLTIPPTLTGRTVLNAIPRVRWWFDFLTTEPIRFSTFDAFDSTVAELLESMYDPTVDFDDLVWRKNRWPGQVVVKCLQTLDDARRCVDLGFDGALLSSHEGRQLDRAPVPFELLPTVVREVGADTEVMIDTGPMAGGRAGVDRAMSILSEDFVRTMKLLGVRSLSELTPDLVTQLRR